MKVWLRWLAVDTIAMGLIFGSAWYAWSDEAEAPIVIVEPTPTIESTPRPTLPLLIAGPPTTRTPTPTWTPLPRGR